MDENTIAGGSAQRRENWEPQVLKFRAKKRRQRRKSQVPAKDCEKILLRLFKGERDKIKQAAADADLTLNAYCRRLLLGLPISD